MDNAKTKELTESEILCNQWLNEGLHIKIGCKTKMWKAGLLKGITFDDLGQIVAVGLILRSRRPGSTYKKEKGSVSNYIWLVATSAIYSYFNTYAVKQAGEEMDLTVYDKQTEEEFISFKEAQIDEEALTEYDDRSESDLIQEVLFNLKLDIDDDLVSERVGEVISLMLKGTTVSNAYTKDEKKIGETWIRKILSK